MISLPYSEARARMLSGDTILWKSKTLVGQLIRMFSRANVNHASTVITMRMLDMDRVFIVEAMANGIELHSLSERIRKSTADAYWLPLKTKYSATKTRFGIRAWAVNRIDVGYDYSDLFKQMFSRVRPDSKKLFCSEFDFLAKRDGGKIGCLQDVKYAPRPGDMEGLGIYEKRVKLT